MGNYPEKNGEQIDFTVFEPGTKHPERGFQIERCAACGLPGIIANSDSGKAYVTHFATQYEGYMASTDDEVCIYETPPVAA